MDYLTNYYKNLCEKLQHKLNALETTVKHLQEAQSSYYDDEYRNYSGGGGMGGGMGGGVSTRDVSSQMPTSSTDRYGNPINDVLNNWGPNGGVGDLNGDGRIDGADLGLALGGGGSMQMRSGRGGPGSGEYGSPTRDTSTGAGTGNQTEGGYGRRPMPPVTRPTTSAGNQTEGGYRTPGTRPTTGSGDQTDQGAPGDLGDLNGDGRVDGADLGLYLARYGQAPSNMKYTRTGQVLGTSPFNPKRRPYSND